MPQSLVIQLTLDQPPFVFVHASFTDKNII